VLSRVRRELRIDGKKVSFSMLPTMVVVRPNLSKNSRRYFTFLPKEACDYLKAEASAIFR